MNPPPAGWPRLRDLPEAERAAFGRWLHGHTAPALPGVPVAEQDAYYPHDYERWRRQHCPPESAPLREICG